MAYNFGVFQAVGECSTEEKHSVRDYNTAMYKASAPVHDLFYEMKIKVNRDTNLIYFPLDQMTHSESRVFYRNLAELSKRQVIKKVKRVEEIKRHRKNMYMFNPRMLMCWGHDTAILIWNQL